MNKVNSAYYGSTEAHAVVIPRCTGSKLAIDLKNFAKPLLWPRLLRYVCTSSTDSQNTHMLSVNSVLCLYKTEAWCSQRNKGALIGRLVVSVSPMSHRLKPAMHGTCSCDWLDWFLSCNICFKWTVNLTHM